MKVSCSRPGSTGSRRPNATTRSASPTSRTPRGIVDKLSAEVGRALKLPDIVERISRTGTKPESSSPKEFEKRVHDEIATRKKVFKAAGVKVE